ncbi:hypothetical protein [Paraburkholderia dinghuensis]|uniref:Uncharacterized protein n=1 Tax=Paraburkholderia dinghuensis TaxID=2305225 RepID=A0A3N6MIX0_9BURK|nr:hypothetical protein [Paraburkholderia dinghuensis]RQH01145.1 hypothetical protein D1Y85_23900 [Paraburkholderia dinghuensis]
MRIRRTLQQSGSDGARTQKRNEEHLQIRPDRRSALCVIGQIQADSNTGVLHVRSIPKDLQIEERKRGTLNMPRLRTHEIAAPLPWLYSSIELDAKVIDVHAFREAGLAELSVRDSGKPGLTS